MKSILVLGAGKSSPYLIQYLLEKAEKFNWYVTVADRDVQTARRRVNGHSHGISIPFDINDSEMRITQIKKADVVINMLSPAFQHMIALACVQYGKHMISVSYQDRRIRDLQRDATRKGVLLLTEIGLDPGIDHMAAAEIIDRVRANGGVIRSFESYGGGLPAMDSLNNPLRYVISWNPRNVVMAGESGAQYFEENKIRIFPHHYVFHHSWPVVIEGIGTLEAYPNRDSLNYKTIYGFEEAHTVIRGTLRFPGWAETWFQIVKLGLPNETQVIPDLKNYTWAQLTEMFLPLLSSPDEPIEQRVANYLGVSPTGEIMKKLEWLGLFSDEKIGIEAETSAEAMTHLLNKKLALKNNIRDMVVLMHRLKVYYKKENKHEKIVSTMIHNGKRGKFTAMAKSVGLPAAIVAKLLLQNKLPLTGCPIPTHPLIYKPVLKEMAEDGLKFVEKVEAIEQS